MLHQAALELENRRVGEAKAQSIELLAQNERHAHMFRHALNPLAASLEAQSHIFASGVAAINEASMHMAASSSHQASQANATAQQFAVAMNQHAEAVRSDPAARRPDVKPMEEAIVPFSGRSSRLETDRGSTKRPKEAAELIERAIGKEPKTNMRAAAAAAAVGAASSSGSVPANNSDLTPWNAVKAPVHISEADQQPLAVAHGKAASSRAAVAAGRARSVRPARGESADRQNLTVDVVREIANEHLDAAEGKKGGRARSRSKSRPAVSLPPKPHDESGGRPIEKVRSTSRQAFRDFQRQGAGRAGR